MEKKRKRCRISRISLMHYCKLVFRSGLFLAALAAYLMNPGKRQDHLFGGIEVSPTLMSVIWLIFVIEMILRFFPSSIESMGCQKQFKRNYKPTGKVELPVKPDTRKGTFISAAAWFILNGVIGVLYYVEIIDAGILLLISLAYSVCDMICILFFCPFQTWFMKNKCCGSCRIYNWDYAMMFTPMVFIPNVYTWSLLFISLGLLVTWEVFVYRHPERFMEISNASLACANCKEKLCHHKVQLRHFLKANRERFRQVGGSIAKEETNI